MNPESSKSNADDRPFRGTRVAVLLFSHYPSDPRPRRAAEALASQGATVDVICLKQAPSDLSSEECGGVNVKRLPLRHQRGGKLSYLFNYGVFILFSFLILSLRTFRARYRVVHVHNMPDVLVFAAAVPKLFGAKVLLDMHDPMPELMAAIYGLPETSLTVRTITLLERWSFRFADHILTVNETCKKIFSSRSCARDKITVIMNSPDEQIFRFNSGVVTRKSEKPFIIMSHGSIVERHGVDLAVQALAAILPSVPSAELRIYGHKTEFLDRALQNASDLKVQDKVKYLGPKNLREITAAIVECDLGVIPNRRSFFTEINTPTRIFEYLSLGKPVIAPRSRGITDYFGPDDLIFFELGDFADLAAKLLWVRENPEQVERILHSGQRIYQAHTWTMERQRFLGRVSSLLTGRVTVEVTDPAEDLCPSA